MKKILLIVLVVFIVPSFVFCLSLSNKSTKEITRLTEASKSMTENEKFLLYNQSIMKSSQPFIGNLMIGFGVGSFIQGDKLGGIIGAVGNGVGVCSLVVGAAINNKTASNTVMILGAAAVLGTRVFNCIRTILYSNEYNRVLKSSVHPDISVTPVVNENNMQLGVTAGIKY